MPRPTEQQVALFHAPLKDYPEHGPGAFRYPRPRKRKGVPLTPEEIERGDLEVPALGAPPGGPIARTWPVGLLADGGARRTTVVTGPYVGWGLVRGINLGLELGGGASGGYTLIVSEDDSGTQQSGTDLTPPSGVSILEPLGDTATFNLSVDEIAGVWPEYGFTSNQNHGNPIDVRYAIRLPRFYLKFTCRSIVGDNMQVRATINFLTDLTPEQLLRYL